MHVAINIAPRYVVRNGLTERASLSWEPAWDRVFGGILGFFFRFVEFGGNVNIRTAGATKRRLRRRGEFA